MSVREPIIYSKSLPGVAPTQCDPTTQNALHEVTKALVVRAWEKQGDRAFDCPMLTAAIHESGHVIIETAFGDIVTKCVISETIFASPSGKSINAWLGLTSIKDKTPFESTNDSPVMDDAIKAAKVYAGLAAEMMFDDDCRAGSSLNELAECQLLCEIVGQKLKIEGEAFYERVHYWVLSALRHYAPAHKAITEALVRNKTLRLRQLQCLTRNIENHRAEFIGRVAVCSTIA